ncbi:hypothetical protein [uncultured Kordia sp.]|uniref:hypothetical protein n=1 Tax=uncultured Kordia sp. TaxID=507699 RepID=UPI00260395BC|nr:hypothetical protein [uncultured Kordia sp.]
MKSIKLIANLTLLLLLTNCISIKKAPEITEVGYSIIEGKKLKKSLGKSNHFIFLNHLSESDLTSFIMYKLNADDNSYLQNMPVKINDIGFLMTFYTVKSKDKTLDLFSPIVNRALNNSLNTGFNEDIQVDEFEYHYVAVYVESDIEADSLKDESIHKAIVEKYLVNLMDEYQRIGSVKELDFIINNN